MPSFRLQRLLYKVYTGVKTPLKLQPDRMIRIRDNLVPSIQLIQ